MKRTVEIFTGGCTLCEPVVQSIQARLKPDVKLILYDLSTGCDDDTCQQKAKEYGVGAVPAVAVDGKLANCCANAGVDLATLEAMGVLAEANA